ncbi:putative Retiin [Operophtera brumata]|uniref:Putative Retiin n=1 Tax=Operophtera brumata TaxID=104452 RepID=A0A0L7LR78_OPEBR|nr:putative Retiin [Operophtera brumata]
MVAHDIYITFYNLKHNFEIVYTANNEKAGDGVDAIAGHKSNLFAFAEKTRAGRIFIVTFPAFNILAELKDMDMNRYKGLCMMECDLVAGFSGFPDYLMSCWGEGLTVWEVAQCYKRCLMMKRSKLEVSGWEVSEPSLVGVCWSSDGQLYAILSDKGIGLVASLEWSDDLTGQHKPCSLKKTESKWKVVFTYTPYEEVSRLISNSTCDMAAMWTKNGLVYRIAGESEEKVLMKYVEGEDVSFEASPVEPLLAVLGCAGCNYGVSLYLLDAPQLTLMASMCLTHQIVSRAVFSTTGRQMIAAAMSAGHIFILNRIICINAETGHDNKFAGKMQGPYSRLLPLSIPDHMLGLPHLARHFHVLRLTADRHGKMQGPYSRLLALSIPDHMLGLPHLARHFHVLRLTADVS